VSALPFAAGRAFAVLDLSATPTLEAVVEAQTVAGVLLSPCADAVITPMLVEEGVWEPAETRYLEEILRPGQTFVDVGAHVGYFSVLAAERVGPEGSVIAVEPEARNLDLLHRNLARNGADRARVIPFAAGATTGWSRLAVDDRNRGGHRLVGSDDGDGGPWVRCVRLDDVLPARVDVIKIDAQGYDHEIVAGLTRTLEANPWAIVIVEFSGTELSRRGIDGGAVLAGYEQLDLTLSMFAPDRVLRRASVVEVLAFAADPFANDDFSVVLKRCPTPRFTPGSRPARVDGLTVEETADGLAVTQPAAGRVHRLNQTAAVVFDLCTGARSVESIAETVRAVYGLAELPLEVVMECLDHLRREGVVGV
jgi:FkbM family methyltransferase